MGSIKHAPGRPCCGGGGTGTGDPGEPLGCLTVPTGFNVGDDVAVRAYIYPTAAPGPTSCPCSFFNQTFLVPVTSKTSDSFFASGTFYSGICDPASNSVNYELTITLGAGFSGCGASVSYASRYRFAANSWAANGATSSTVTGLGSWDMRDPLPFSTYTPSGIIFCVPSGSHPVTFEIWTP